MGYHAHALHRPQRTVTLYTAHFTFMEDGRMSTRLYEYPAGLVQAVNPILAWEGLWAGLKLPILQAELRTLYQALAAVIAEDQG